MIHLKVLGWSGSLAIDILSQHLPGGTEVNHSKSQYSRRASQDSNRAPRKYKLGQRVRSPCGVRCATLLILGTGCELGASWSHPEAHFWEHDYTEEYGASRINVKTHCMSTRILYRLRPPSRSYKLCEYTFTFRCHAGLVVNCYLIFFLSPSFVFANIFVRNHTEKIVLETKYRQEENFKVNLQQIWRNDVKCVEAPI